VTNSTVLAIYFKHTSDQQDQQWWAPSRVLHPTQYKKRQVFPHLHWYGQPNSRHTRGNAQNKKIKTIIRTDWI